MNFKEVTYRLADDVSITVHQATIHGQPIIDTKKTEVRYQDIHMKINRENEYNNVFSALLMRNLFQTQTTLEFGNYLSRLFNHENLFNVYTQDPIFQDDKKSMLKFICNNNIDIYEASTIPNNAGKETFYVCSNEHAQNKSNSANVNAGNNKLHAASRDATQNDSNSAKASTQDSIYVNKLIHNSHVEVGDLNKYRSKNQPICVHNFDEINFVPIFTYVHPKLAINQGSTIHLMHLALLFKQLMKMKSFSEFSNAKSISILSNALNQQTESYEQVCVERDEYKNKYEEAMRKIKELEDRFNKIKSENVNEEPIEKIDVKKSIIDELADKYEIKHERKREPTIIDELVEKYNISKPIEKIDKLVDKYEIVKPKRVINVNLEIKLKKLEIINTWKSPYIEINRYNRLVYAIVDNKPLPIDQVKKAHLYDWIYRYGQRGKCYKIIDHDILMSSVFTNKHDTRIRYE